MMGSEFWTICALFQKANSTTSTWEWGPVSMWKMHLSLSQPPVMYVGTRNLKFQLEKPGCSLVRKRLPDALSEYIFQLLKWIL